VITLEHVLEHDGQPLTTAEVGSVLRRSERTIRRWIANGELPALTLGHGRKIVISRGALRRFVLDRAAHAGAPEMAAMQ
jgi:excisionase family DNA binding protein